jgi:hypothetical protein
MVTEAANILDNHHGDNAGKTNNNNNNKHKENEKAEDKNDKTLEMSFAM